MMRIVGPELQVHGAIRGAYHRARIRATVGYCALLPWAISVVKVDEVTPFGLVFMKAQVANMDANKHITAIKPVYFEPRLPLPGGFS